MLSLAITIIKLQAEVSMGALGEDPRVLHTSGVAEEHGRSPWALRRTKFSCEPTRCQALWKRVLQAYLILTNFLRGEPYPHFKDREVGPILGRADESGFAPKPESLGS